jgi:hypothetical protein
LLGELCADSDCIVFGSTVEDIIIGSGIRKSWRKSLCFSSEMKTWGEGTPRKSKQHNDVQSVMRLLEGDVTAG